MGLGKTLQSIAFLGALHKLKGQTGPHLVVVPLSVLMNWMNEIKVRAFIGECVLCVYMNVYVNLCSYVRAHTYT